MRPLALLLLAGICISPCRAQVRPINALRPRIIPARFGEPARFDRGILQYPGFTVRLARRAQYLRPDDLPAWTVWQFEILHDDRTIGGDIIFNSERRANGRRFDAAGKLYLVEMFHSTAGLKEGEPVPLTARLAADEIVIWDEASARARNASLARIWRDEKVDPNERYFPANAYANGVLLAGFGPPLGKINDELKQLKENSLEIERVRLLRDEAAPSGRATPGIYGQRANVRAGAIKYPDFTLALASREETNPADPYLAAVNYGFKIYAASPATPNLSFDTSTGANGRRFRAGPAMYFAEMFFTTAGAGSTHATRPLGPDEFIVWDEATARRTNPRIVDVFAKAADNPNYADRFASGVPLHETMFTGTYLINNAGSRPAELDAPVGIVHDAVLDYPSAYAGTGYAAQVGGYVIIAPDGTVAEAQTTYGNNPAFQEISARAVRAMRFTVPKRHGLPTRVLVNFLWRIAEPNCDTTSVRFNWPE